MTPKHIQMGQIPKHVLKSHNTRGYRTASLSCKDCGQGRERWPNCSARTAFIIHSASSHSHISPWEDRMRLMLPENHQKLLCHSYPSQRSRESSCFIQKYPDHPKKLFPDGRISHQDVELLVGFARSWGRKRANLELATECWEGCGWLVTAWISFLGDSKTGS